MALILNLALPYDVEEDTDIIAETDAQVAEHGAGIGMSKETPEVAEKKIDELDV